MMYLDVHSHTQHSSPDTLVIRNQHPLTAHTSEPFSVGIHPWFSTDWQTQWDALLPLAEHPNCWAIGECGIDKNTTTPLPLQQEIFLKHIQLSEAQQLPLIIHCVKAYGEIISLKKQTQAKQLWILHGFRKNLSTANALLAHNIIPSFGAALLYDTKLQDVFAQLNHRKELLPFFETDDKSLSVKQIYAFAKKISR